MAAQRGQRMSQSTSVCTKGESRGPAAEQSFSQTIHIMSGHRSPYDGVDRKLVLAFDVGTTYSGISYSILNPGEVPEVKGVTRFPAQERVGGASKIPTIIYYDQEGKVRAIGAEATKEGVEQTAEDEGWTKAEWFKLHLRPYSANRSSIDVRRHLPPLPKNKSVVDLFSDYMQYLYNCAKTYIQDTHEDDNELWASLEPRIEYVLTHPNGWEGAQQEQMRKAAIIAGLVPDTDTGRSRIRFVTEGEASLHFCLRSGLGTQALKNGDGILIVDAGGGTIDLSAYTQASPSSRGLSLIEILPSECHFQGSFFVTSRARVFFENLLRNTKFADDVDNITNCFDRTTKLTFRSITDPQFIKFGSTRDRDPKLNIRSGQLKLLGPDVANFFQPSIACIVQAVIQQRDSAEKNITSIFLVGGFGASDWLYNQLKDSLEQYGLRFCRPDSHVNKAVADGAISFYLDHRVTARISKVAYGIGCSVPFVPSDREHQRRSASIYTSLAGVKQLPRAFSVILHKGMQVNETIEFRRHYLRVANDRSQLENTMAELKCYNGTSEDPQWLDVDAEMYTTLCYVGADTSLISKNLQPRRSSAGKTHYALEFEIILLFGLTELKAQIAWKEEGQEKRSEARIVYDTIHNQ